MEKIYNPLQKDYATFLTTGSQSGGEVTKLEVELAPGGGNALHFHRAFSERFEVLEGKLVVQVEREMRTLGVGETALAERGVRHCFSNATASPTRFLVELRPASRGFENALRIAYGLASDGGMDPKSRLPKSLLHLAVLATMAETYPVGAAALFFPLLTMLARSKKGRRAEAELLSRYCNGAGPKPSGI